MVNDCRIDSYYVKPDEPYTKYNDSFYLYTHNEFSQSGPNTWKGHFGPYSITVIQQHRQYEITEEDVKIEKNDNYKSDSDIKHGLPSRSAIAKALNEHLDEIFR